MDQIEEYGPPPAPAKVTDSRASAYIARHGHSSWELDALEPRVLNDLIRTSIRRVLDSSKYSEKILEESAGQDRLGAVADELENE